MGLIQKPYVGARLNKNHPLSQGLIGCWMMNEGSGAKVIDLSGYENPGTISGANWTAGGLNFDESGNKYVSVADSDIFSFGTSPFTFILSVNKKVAVKTNPILTKYYNVDPFDGEGFVGLYGG